MSKKPVYTLVDELPNRGLTVMSLKALDFAVPGAWNNLTGFVNTIKEVTGETDEALIQEIGDRAITLYNDKSEGYQKALWLYQTVDSASSALGTGMIANKATENISFLGLINKLTPKPEKAQSFDLTVKLVVELVAFCQINGIPGDSIGDFLGAVKDYGGESLMRMAALVCYDGLVPLGPSFAEKGLATLKQSSASDLDHNKTFKGVKELIPGNRDKGKLAFITESFESVQDWMLGFVDDRGLTQDKVVTSLSKAVDLSQDKLEYLGAFLDVGTNYYEHTGIQTLTRRLIERAAAEV